MFGMVFARNRKNATACSQQPTFSKIARRVLFKKHSRCGEKQEQAKQVKYEIKTLDQRDTTPDHRAAHDECANNSPNQNATLCVWRDVKVREDQHENENIIHAQRILD